MKLTRLAAGVATALLFAGCAQLSADGDTRAGADATLAGLSTEPHALDTLWQRVRAGLSFADATHPDIQRQLGQLRARHIDTVAERALPFLDLVLDEAQQRGMPAEIALLPMLESGYQPQAVSPGKAVGLWQIMPGTAAHLGLRRTAGYDARRDVQASTTAALDYLQTLNRTFDGDWLLTLAAYNSGSRTVQRAIEANRRSGKSTEFWDLTLPRGTQDYVPRLLALSKMIAEPVTFGLSLREPGHLAELTVVEISSQVDLSFAVAAAGLSPEQFYRFNAGLQPGVRQLDQPIALLLPRENARALQQRLDTFAGTRFARWDSYRVNFGDTVESLAQRFDTSPAALAEVNRQAGKVLGAGRDVLVPAVGADAAAGPAVRSLHPVTAADDILAVSDQPLRERIRHLMTVNYPVQSGDSLTALSGQFRVSVEDLRKWNTLPESTLAASQLEPGRTLIVYLDAPVEVPRG